MPTVGYSGTPLAKKLGIVDGTRVALIAEPEGFRTLLEPLPDAVDFATIDETWSGLRVVWRRELR